MMTIQRVSKSGSPGSVHFCDFYNNLNKQHYHKNQQSAGTALSDYNVNIQLPKDVSLESPHEYW